VEQQLFRRVKRVNYSVEATTERVVFDVQVPQGQYRQLRHSELQGRSRSIDVDQTDVKDNAVVPGGGKTGWETWHSAQAPDGTRNGLGPLGGTDQSISTRADAARGREMTNELVEERGRSAARRGD
jgi:hypothetical protein